MIACKIGRNWIIFEIKKIQQKVGLHSTEVTFVLLAQQPRVQYLAFQKIHFDVAKIYHQRWLDESEQRLENVDQAGAIKKGYRKTLVAGFWTGANV